MAKKLLFSLTKKDFDVKAFQAGGKGGQHQNKVSTAIRITHRASGAAGVSRSQKSQYQNKKLAFDRLIKTSKFNLWLNRQVFEITSEKTIDEMVDESIQDKNLKIEIRDENNKWAIYNLDERS